MVRIAAARLELVITENSSARETTQVNSASTIRQARKMSHSAWATPRCRR